MPPPINLPFSGKRLRVLRELNGWTQQGLSDATAEVTGERVLRDRISLYELDKVVPSVGNFSVLVKTLGCNPRDLLHTSDLPEAS